jgi:hypothetical protein
MNFRHSPQRRRERKGTPGKYIGSNFAAGCCYTKALTVTCRFKFKLPSLEEKGRNEVTRRENCHPNLVLKVYPSRVGPDRGIAKGSGDTIFPKHSQTSFDSGDIDILTDNSDRFR